MIAGIYALENLLDGAKYIGQGIDVKRRMNAIHNGSAALERALRYYGEMNFKRYVLLYCEPWELDRYERECIKALKTLTTENGYNVVSGSRGEPRKKRTPREQSEIYQKIWAYLAQNATDEFVPGPTEVAHALSVSKGYASDVIKEFRAQHFPQPEPVPGDD
jgi:hypothetical protein